MLGLLIATIAAGHSSCVAGREYEPRLCPLHLPAIRSLTINERSSRRAGDPEIPVSCATFRPTLAQVRHYLVAAKTTDPESADATVDRSPCHASGRVRFADGRIAKWEVEQLRAGTLTFAGRAPILLYCRDCRTPPFHW